MPHVLAQTVYYFDELADKAKERARDWYRNGALDHKWWDSVTDDAKEIAALFGLTIREYDQKFHVEGRDGKPGRDGTSHELAIFFSGFASQGDGACFEGRYQFKADAVQAVKDHAPLDAKLHAIIERIQAAQAPVFGAVGFDVRHVGHYSHSGCMEFDSIEADESLESELAKLASDAVLNAEREVIEALRAFADWIYRALEAEHDALLSDESVDENIKLNEYEFTKEGARA